MADRRLSDHLASLLTSNRRLTLGVGAAAAVGAAWLLRFSQDDAFISYRYARNLARGDGLVFNPGERVEGYTNFLWTVIHVIPEKYGWSTPLFSQILGVALFAATLVVVFRLGCRLTGDDGRGLLVAVVAAVNVTFLGYATGGLETMLQTLLVTSVAVLLLGSDDTSHRRATWRRLGAGALAGFALLTRLDSSVLIGVWFVWALHELWSGTAARDARQRVVVTASGAAQLAAPVLVLIVPWMAWKVGYYGSLVPNTLVAKSGISWWQPLVFGIAYLLLYVVSYGAVLLVPRLWRARRSLVATSARRGVLAAVLSWLVYVVIVGGDFMEFRFLVPVTPLLAVIAADLIDRYRHVAQQVALVVVLLGASLFHAVTPTLIPPLLSFSQLDNWPKAEVTTWAGMGRTLARVFPDSPGSARPTIAVAPLGLIGYYSDLPTVDMVGLTDPWVARHGDTFRFYVPGHIRFAPVRHLLSSGVNLVIGEPVMVEPAASRVSYRLSELIAAYPASDLRELPDEARVIEMPLDSATSLVVIYLTRTPVVDDAIAAGGWRTFAIDRTCDSRDITLFVRLAGSRTCPGLGIG